MSALLATPLRGIVPPLITPLRDRDTLDGEGLNRLIEHILAGGVAGLFVLGTTGEGPALSYRLRYELVERAAEIVAGRVPLFVGVTDTSLAEAVDLARWAEDVGADAVVAAPPYYFPLTDSLLFRYFQQLAEESPLPVVLYNMPACTHCSISRDLLARCADLPNVIGFKDSSGDLTYFRAALELRQARPDWFFLVGPEHLLAESAALGGDGGVNGGANLAPRLFVDLFEAACKGDEATVGTLQTRLLQLGRIYEGEPPVGTVIQGLKLALGQLGLCADTLLEPHGKVTEQRRQQIGRTLDQLGLTPASVAPPA